MSRKLSLRQMPKSDPWTLTGNILFSLVDVIAKALAEDYAVNQIIFFRMFFGLAPAVLLLRGSGSGGKALTTARPLTHLWRAVTGLGAMGLFFFALPLMPLADAVALSFFKPFFLAILAVPLLGERLTRPRMFATFVGFFGVLVKIRPSGSYTEWLGPVLALSNALCFAVSMITIPKLSKTESTALIVFCYTTTATLVAGISLLGAWATPSVSDLGLFLLIGVAGGPGQLLM